MLTVLWLLTGAAVIVAAAALMKARRLARRLERLSESFWELKYESGQLRARLNRLDPEPGADIPERPQQPGVTAFVPLSSVKR